MVNVSSEFSLYLCNTIYIYRERYMYIYIYIYMRKFWKGNLGGLKSDEIN